MVRGTLFSLFVVAAAAGPASQNPYDRQVDGYLAMLRSGTATARARAAEMLGFMRAYRAEPALMGALANDSPVVRRRWSS